MKPVLFWDLPTRLFHWLLAAGCSVAFILALGAPEQSRAFDVHMLVGLILAPLLLFRLFWGFAGTLYARFRSFLYRPGEALSYLVGMVTRKSRRHPGHNPAASYVIWAMLILVPGCVVSGLLIPGSKFFEELHEILSYTILVVVGAHLLGVLLHAVVHRENLVVSMVTGTKRDSGAIGISSSRPLVALFLFVLTGTWTAAVVTSYDVTTRRLDVPLVGTVIHLGNSEQHHGAHGEHDDD